MIGKILICSLAIVAVGCGLKHKRGANVDAVVEFYRSQKAQTEVCYKKGLAEDKALQGKVILAWKVDQSGRAQNARIVSSQLANATTEKCLLDHLLGLNFPPQQRFSPASVEYELNLSTGR